MQNKPHLINYTVLPGSHFLLTSVLSAPKTKKQPLFSCSRLQQLGQEPRCSRKILLQLGAPVLLNRKEDQVFYFINRILWSSFPFCFKEYESVLSWRCGFILEQFCFLRRHFYQSDSFLFASNMIRGVAEEPATDWAPASARSHFV